MAEIPIHSLTGTYRFGTQTRFTDQLFFSVHCSLLLPPKGGERNDQIIVHCSSNSTTLYHAGIWPCKRQPETATRNGNQKRQPEAVKSAPVYRRDRRDKKLLIPLSQGQCFWLLFPYEFGAVRKARQGHEDHEGDTKGNKENQS